MAISVSGNPALCDDPVTYTINIDAAGSGVPGQAPYNYKWQLGNGVFTNDPYSTFKSYGNTNSISINPLVDLPQNSEVNFYLYASAMSAEGVFVNNVLQIKRICLPEKPAETSLVSALAISKVSVYPNPANSALLITSPNFAGDANYSIHSVDGKMLSFGQIIMAETQPTKIQINLPNGYYTLQISSDMNFISTPFIVEN